MPARWNLDWVRSVRPGWQIWESRGGCAGAEPSGNLYATPDHLVPERDCNLTLYAQDPRELADLITQQEDFWAGMAPSPPAGHWLHGFADS